VVFAVVDWVVSVRNCTGPLADAKAGRSHALVDNLDDDYNYDIGDRNPLESRRAFDDITPTSVAFLAAFSAVSHLRLQIPSVGRNFLSSTSLSVLGIVPRSG